jgi:hypothetical protein
MAPYFTSFDPRLIEAFREAKPALALQHQMRPCPSDLSHYKGMKKSVGQFAAGDTLCKTCRRRMP